MIRADLLALHELLLSNSTEHAEISEFNRSENTPLVHWRGVENLNIDEQEYHSWEPLQRARTNEGLNDNSLLEAFEAHGLDAFGCYKSFRLKDSAPFRGDWGIFLFVEGLKWLQDLLVDHGNDSKAHSDYWSIARDLLIFHEVYHFWVDAWCLRYETSKLPTGKIDPIYLKYLRNGTAYPSESQDLEEVLANDFAFQKVVFDYSRVCPSLRDALTSLSLYLPNGIETLFLNTTARNQKEDFLCLALASGGDANQFGPISNINKLTKTYSPKIYHHLSKRLLPKVLKACPIKLVKESNYLSQVKTFAGPDIAEIRRFIVDYASGRKLTRTDHEYFQIDNGEKVKFPNPHLKRLKPHEFNNIRNKVGLTNKGYDHERRRTHAWKKDCPREQAVPAIKS